MVLERQWGNMAALHANQIISIPLRSGRDIKRLDEEIYSVAKFSLVESKDVC